MQDSEIQESTEICNVKCVKEPKCKYIVYDTTKCNDGKLYSIYQDGKLYDNVNLRFRIFADGTAKLKGKVSRHGDESKLFVDIDFMQGSENDFKYPNCLDEEVNVNEWIQYVDVSGTITDVEDGHVYQISRRGNPTQLGIGANPTNKFLTLGLSGWYWAERHVIVTGKHVHLLHRL